jgi:hypothetical protein
VIQWVTFFLGEIMGKKMKKIEQVNGTEFPNIMQYALIEEYKTCLSQYAYRDVMSITLFTAINAIIGFIFINVWTNIEKYDTSTAKVIELLTIAIFGFVILFVLMLDLHKVLSCKEVLRNRVSEIEKYFQNFSTPSMPVFSIENTISKRDGRSFFEVMFGRVFSVSQSMYFFTTIILFAWIFFFGFKFFDLFVTSKLLVS